jgi:hypothetical protein
MVDWMLASMLCILLAYRATAYGDCACNAVINISPELPPGRDMDARAPWDAFPDYYL